MRNFVLEATNAYFYRDGKREEDLAVYNNCANNFSIIHIMNIIAYTEALKVVDIIDERKMRKHMVKTYLKEYEGKYDAYMDFMRKHMNKDVWPLLHDYARVVWSNMEGKANLLRQACYNYLKKNDVKECKLLAQTEVAKLLWKIAADMFQSFFKKYKEKCGVDFSADFEYGNMALCSNRWQKLTDELFKGVTGINFNNDRRCRDACQDLYDTLDDTSLFDKSAAMAIQLNPGLKEKYIKD